MKEEELLAPMPEPTGEQDAVPHDMAGQFDEHEMARSLTPLLFSFSDRDAPARYVML